MVKINPAYEKIIDSLKKYSDYNKISINRARYIIGIIHRMPRPYNTKIISDMARSNIIKLHGANGLIEILI